MPVGPRILQNFHGLLLSYWTQGVPGCRDPTGSHWIPPDPSGSHWVPRAAVLVNPRCLWIQGSHRIRRDANGSRWVPLGSTGLAGYTWLSVPPGSYWIHGVLASTDPTGFLRLAAGLLRPWWSGPQEVEHVAMLSTMDPMTSWHLRCLSPTDPMTSLQRSWLPTRDPMSFVSCKPDPVAKPRRIPSRLCALMWIPAWIPSPRLLI